MSHSHNSLPYQSTYHQQIKKDEQIPTEYNEVNTLRVIRKQNRIPGQRRDKVINDFPNAAAIAQILKNLDFPANKNKIIQYVEKQIRSDKPEGHQILPILQKIEERRYKKILEITLAAKLVE
jgi:hypothetical protein